MRRAVSRQDFWAGVLFVLVAGLGLWLSRDYPVGTALRMGTGYLPRLLCWLLLAMGVATLLGGFLSRDAQTVEPIHWRPPILVACGFVAFALSVDRLGIVVAGGALLLLGGAANRDARPWEVVVATMILLLLTWAIFIAGLGLQIPLWPEL
jgi:hypothetical protein